LTTSPTFFSKLTGFFIGGVILCGITGCDVPSGTEVLNEQAAQKCDKGTHLQIKLDGNYEEVEEENPVTGGRKTQTHFVYHKLLLSCIEDDSKAERNKEILTCAKDWRHNTAKTGYKCQ
jgi:hypothetical protein